LRVSGDAKSLQFFDHRVILARLLQRGAEVLPEQTTELFLSSRGREGSSLVVCPVALCTCMVEAQVGQEGIGETDQMPVCHGRSIQAMLVLAESQPRLGVLHPRCAGPAPVVRLEQLGGRELRGLGDQPADRLGRPCPRADDLEEAQVADREPAGLDNAVAGAAVGLRDGEGRGAKPSHEIVPRAPRLELPAGLHEVAMAFASGGQRAALLSAGLDHGWTEIIGSTRLVVHTEPDTPGDDVRSEEQRATDVLVAANIGAGRGVLHLGHRLQALPAFGLLGIVEDQIHGGPRPGGQSPEPLLRLLPPGRFGVPALHQEEVVDAGPVGRGLQLSVEVGHLRPAAGEGHHHDQPAERLARVPMNVAVQAT
jgi:hypothetical protein